MNGITGLGSERELIVRKSLLLREGTKDEMFKFAWEPHFYIAIELMETWSQHGVQFGNALHSVVVKNIMVLSSRSAIVLSRKGKLLIYNMRILWEDADC